MERRRYRLTALGQSQSFQLVLDHSRYGQIAVQLDSPKISQSRYRLERLQQRHMSLFYLPRLAELGTLCAEVGKPLRTFLATFRIRYRVKLRLTICCEPSAVPR